MTAAGTASSLMVIGQAATAANAREFFLNLFTGAAEGEMLSLLVIGIAVVLLLRLVAARWVFMVAKQTLVFGGLGYAVWFFGGWMGDNHGTTARVATLAAGGIIVGGLFLAMLFMALKRHGREKAAETRKGAPTKAATGAKEEGAPMEFEAKATPAGEGAGAKAKATEPGKAQAPVAAAPAAAAHDTSHLEDMLKKINVLGAHKDQNLLTVMVLILVAEFGVFTSKTVAAPSAQVGMILAAIFAGGAVIFVKTSYKKYWTGIRHFVFATVFAVGLSVLMLVYWQTEPAVTLGEAINPNVYFASDALIAAITGVAFSTLLTKGGG